MEALVFAAGLGTRLHPLTAKRPKALVEVAGAALLDHVVLRLVDAGVTRLVINVHHHAASIEAHVRERDGFGIEVLFSREEAAPLETGGGLRAAAPLLSADAPLFLHNTDVISDLDLGALYARHVRTGPLATLAVMDRPTKRHLLFDDRGLLGRSDATRDLDLRVRDPEGSVTPLGFSGVHVVSPSLLPLLTDRGAFSIVEAYVRLAGEGHRILPHRVDGCGWVDVGRPESLAPAERLLATMRRRRAEEERS